MHRVRRGRQLGILGMVQSWIPEVAVYGPFHTAFENFTFQSVPATSLAWLGALFEVLRQLLSINKACPVPSEF